MRFYALFLWIEFSSLPLNSEQFNRVVVFVFFNILQTKYIFKLGLLLGVRELK